MFPYYFDSDKILVNFKNCIKSPATILFKIWSKTLVWFGLNHIFWILILGSCLWSTLLALGRWAWNCWKPYRKAWPLRRVGWAKPCSHLEVTMGFSLHSDHDMLMLLDENSIDSMHIKQRQVGPCQAPPRCLPCQHWRSHGDRHQRGTRECCTAQWQTGNPRGMPQPRSLMCFGTSTQGCLKYSIVASLTIE